MVKQCINEFKTKKISLTIYQIIKIIIIILYFLEFKFIEKKYRIIPKISIYLPIYNKGKYLNRSIGSIQKQTLTNIEIIPVNDCSNDDTLKILKIMAKKDKRIKIINNLKNKGLLYSRAMGIINSKGEYLMNLDPDDELSASDNLAYLYNKTMNSTIDIVTFNLLFTKNKFTKQQYLRCNNFNKIAIQPQLFYNANKLKDYLITNKLIKREILLKAYDAFKSRIYGEKWNYGEDEIWSILVNKFSNSMICVSKNIFFYYSNHDSLSHNNNNELFILNLLYWFEMFQKLFKLFAKNNESFFENRLSVFLYMIQNIHYIHIIKKNKNLKNKYINAFKMIIIKKEINNVNLKIKINRLLKKLY